MCVCVVVVVPSIGFNDVPGGWHTPLCSGWHMCVLLYTRGTARAYRNIETAVCPCFTHFTPFISCIYSTMKLVFASNYATECDVTA